MLKETGWGYRWSYLTPTTAPHGPCRLALTLIKWTGFFNCKSLWESPDPGHPIRILVEVPG